MIQSRILKEYDFKLFSMVAVLGKGKCFGELALINSQRRAARIICTKSTIFGILDKKDYEKVVGGNLKKAMNEKC